MHLRLFRIVLILASATALAACESTMGVKDGQTGSTSTGVGTSGSFQGHMLDDPGSALANRAIYFKFDSSDVLDSQRATVEAHARYLARHSGASIILEGHADERGSREYNIALGERRAKAVRKLMTLLGSTGQQIRTKSFGEERPANSGHNESAWKLNRRVEIIYRVRE